MDPKLAAQVAVSALCLLGIVATIKFFPKAKEAGEILISKGYPPIVVPLLYFWLSVPAVSIVFWLIPALQFVFGK